MTRCRLRATTRNIHSNVERRFVTFGISASGRLLVVAHADRNDSIRIISARPATRSEKGIYEESH
jgi:uncharacterized DUF497 family protein